MADLEKIESSWGALGRENPMWAAMSLGGHAGDQWSVDEFLASGEDEIRQAMGLAEATTQGGLARDAALDFGCGPGRLVYGLAKAGFRNVLGIDVAESMVEVARSLNRFPDTCSFSHNVRTDLDPVPNGSMSFVYSARVLQHMPSPLALGYVGEFVRALSPVGRAVFQIPTAPRWTGGGLAVRLLPTALASRLRSGMEMHGTSADAVRQAVERAGGVVLAQHQDDKAGPRWHSSTYVVGVQ